MVRLLVAFIVLSAFSVRAEGWPPLASQVVVDPAELTPNGSWDDRLRQLFQRVAVPASTPDEIVTRLVDYLRTAIYHPLYAPIDENGTAVYDPIWVLSNRLGHCGQTNRVLVDMLAAVGYQARLVQLTGHVAAEVYYEGDWHYLDADALAAGDEIRDANGDIPSAAEIAADLTLVAHIDAYSEADNYPVSVIQHPPFDYASTFVPTTYGAFTTPYAYLKTATAGQMMNRYYGWNYYQTVQIPPIE